jgi:hypothetical protein
MTFIFDTMMLVYAKVYYKLWPRFDYQQKAIGFGLFSAEMFVNLNARRPV